MVEFTPKGSTGFFVCSGSESIDSAMKMALAITVPVGRVTASSFISRERAYHGVNMGGVALAGMINNRKAFGGRFAGRHHMRHTALPQNNSSRASPNTGPTWLTICSATARCTAAKTSRRCLWNPLPDRSVACHRQGYLDRLRAICDQHGIPLVFDEVITGWGRTGANFAAQAFGVTPDI